MKWNNLRRVLEEYTTALEKAVKDGMPTNWALRNDIFFILNINEDQYEITFKAPSYWKYANYGRNPGKMPPTSEIESWIIRKRITPRALSGRKIPSVTSLAYVIARKIGREGIKGKHFIENSLNNNSQLWEDRISDAIAVDISSQLDEWLHPLNSNTRL